jgi:hypothetical protein
MIFELRLGEIRLWCSSPECTRTLVKKGARLVNPAQAEDLRRALGSAVPVPSLDAAATAPAE